MATFGPYPFRIVEVHDGDTVLGDIDLGFGVFLHSKTASSKTWLSCRVFGINAPELRTVEGDAALVYARTLLSPGDVCRVTSHGWDAYAGRFDGDIELPDGRDFAHLMVDSGHAVWKTYK